MPELIVTNQYCVSADGLVPFHLILAIEKDKT